MDGGGGTVNSGSRRDLTANPSNGRMSRHRPPVVSLRALRLRRCCLISPVEQVLLASRRRASSSSRPPRSGLEWTAPGQGDAVSSPGWLALGLAFEPAPGSRSGTVPLPWPSSSPPLRWPAGGSPFDVRVRSAVSAAWRSLLHVVAAPSFLLPPARDGGNRLIGESRGLLVSVLRGTAIGLPVIGVVGLLLASADPVFASFFNLSVDPPDLFLHALLSLIGAWLVGGLVRAASGDSARTEGRAGWRLGATEVITVLAVLDMVFLAYAIAQLVGALGAGGDALRAAGVTYSDYARSGFFQLLWVAGITFVSLLALSAMVRTETPRSLLAVKVLAELAVALTLVILFVAWRRLSTYEDAYGWTMLRFYSHAFAAWIAVAFCSLAVWIAGINAQRPAWIYGATATAGIGALVVLNLINPEALVVRLNVSRPDMATFDPAYLAGLSEDATSEALSPDVPSRFAARLRTATCSRRATRRDWAAFNLSSVLADAKRSEACQ